MPALLTLGVLTFLLALAGVALAVLANRRLMAQRRALRSALTEVRASAGAPAPTAADGSPSAQRAGEDRLAGLATQVTDLHQGVATLSAEVAGLRESGTAWSARLAAVGEQSHGLSTEVATLRGDVEDFAELGSAILELADGLDPLRERLAGVEESVSGLDERSRAAEILGAAAHEQAQTTRDLGTALTLQVEHLTGRVAALAEQVVAAETDPTSLRHVAVVRYDAFADVGGRLSYSLAALDDTRTGFVLTTLAGKSEVRTYVRTVSGGVGDGNLTAEELQAIDAACEEAGFRDRHRLPG